MILITTYIKQKLKGHFKLYGIEYTEELIKRTYKNNKIALNKLLYCYNLLIKKEK